MRTPFWTATRFALMEQTRNRFALGLLAVFIPLWDVMFASVIPSGPVDFRLQSSGAFLMVDGQHLTALASGFNAITLIVGFMIFSATRRNGSFDRRLVLAGLPQSTAVAAKLVSILAVSAAVSLYASLVLLAIFPGVSLAAVWLGYTLDALIYGALGLLLGVLVTSELPGFFLIIMVSLLDTLFQIPVENPVANKPFLAYFPSFGPVQVAVSGGFGHPIDPGSVAIALAWFAGFAGIALAVFWLRTRLPRGVRGPVVSPLPK